MNSQRSNNFCFGKPFLAVLITLFFSVALFAQVDPTFNAAVSRDTNSENTSGVNAKLALQPDGKILVFGTNFNNVRGVPKNKMARLNSDGTLDNSFNCTGCNGFGVVSSAVAQPDGKIVIAGAFSSFPFRRIARINADGSLDNTFVSPYEPNAAGSLTVWAIQPDGKIMVTEHYAGFHIAQTTLRRLNANGSFDNTFNYLSFDGWNAKEFLYDLQLLPGGKMMLGGKHAFGYVFRINADGTKDTSFESPTMTSQFPQAPPIVYSFAIQSTGKVVINGSWVTINGLNISNFARLNADGSVDQTFDPPFSPFRIELLSGDKLLLDGSIRLNADGSTDNSFAAAYTVGAWVVDSMERIVITTSITEGDVTSRFVARMNPDGSADGTFNPAYLGFAGEVHTLAVQADGKVIIGGYFNRVNGTVRKSLARVNTDGTLDASFNAGTATGESEIKAIAIQADGKILIGGNFQLYDGTARNAIARINSDGTLDNTFNPILSTFATVYAIALQPDGNILIGGSFSSVNSTNRTSIARLNSNGTLDNAFNPTLGSATVFSLFVQSDTKIMVGGSFSGVNGFNRANFTRLNSDGTLDTAFNAGSIGSVIQISPQPDGKYLVISNGTLVRRHSDGTADGSFPAVTTNGAIFEFLVQPNGYIIVVGSFTNINNTTRFYVARLRPDGIVDSFLAIGADKQVNTVVGQMDGKFYIGGQFSTIENIARNAVARIESVNPQPRALFDFDGDGKADVAVFRPSENKWYILRSSDLGVTQQVWGIAGDVPVPADYDGDGKTDFAIFRPSSGDWWSLSSISGAQVYAHWGGNGDVPRPSDFDGDGRADYIVYRPSNFYWYRISSANGASSVQQFGLTGDKPVTGDFDGDGKSDKAIFRPSSGDWWYQSSINGAQLAVHWGVSTDVPAPADFDGDGKTDFAVYRPSTGTWYIINSSNGSFTIMNFGISEDKPVPADYDGDGKADIAVFRPSSGAWYLQRSAAGFWALNWGISTDIPVENAFVP